MLYQTKHVCMLYSVLCTCTRICQWILGINKNSEHFNLAFIAIIDIIRIFLKQTPNKTKLCIQLDSKAIFCQLNQFTRHRFMVWFSVKNWAKTNDFGHKWPIYIIQIFYKMCALHRQCKILQNIGYELKLCAKCNCGAVMQ